MREAMRELVDFLICVRCVVIKYIPIRHEVGLFKIGEPGPDSPVVVSGNYFHTVKRLMKALRGRDCHLLVCDSAGINVWCAAGVCDFNEHKIADAANSCGLKSVVNHDRLILPQLAAVGVDLKALFAECGFRGTWGPASLRDIGRFIDAGMSCGEKDRVARFPADERFHNAVGMFAVFFVPALALRLIFGRKFAHRFHAILLMNFAGIFANFMLYDKLPLKYPANNSLLVGAFTFAAIFVYSYIINPAARAASAFYFAAAAVINLLVSIDMLGSTPFYKTTIAHWLATFDNKSLFQPKITGGCTGCGECAKVCPKGIFVRAERSDRAPAGVHADLSRECCECLACVKQCPSGAIANANGRLFKDDIKSVPGLDRVMR